MRNMMGTLCILATVAAAGALPAFASEGWETDFEKAKQRSAETGRPILADFSGSDWCIWCKRLDAEVFSQAAFKTYAEGNLVLFLADFPRKSNQTEAEKKQNEALAQTYKIQGFPTVLLLDAAGKEVARTGYQEGGAEKYVEHVGGLIEKAQADGKLKLESKSAPAQPNAAEQEGAWLTDFEKAKQAAAEAGRPILADFSGSDWCIWCKRLDAEVFSQAPFKAYAEANLVLFLADFPRKSEQAEAEKKQNEALAQTFKIQGFPTVLLLDAQGGEVARTGYQEGGAEKYVEHIDGLIEKAKADGKLKIEAKGPKARIVEVKRIWDKAPHNAFTDLIRFQNMWYCAFREAKGHGVEPDGALRVIASADGEAWEPVALLASPRGDVRDAKLSITPKGELMASGSTALTDKSNGNHQGMAWFTTDGKAWEGPVEVADPSVWLWRVTWHKGTAWGVGYSTGDEPFVRLYKSADGRKYETVAANMGAEGFPNESQLLFREDDTALCLLRRDGATSSSALLGEAKPPYTDWTWHDLKTQLGGPVAIELPDGRFVAAGRLYDDPVRTSLCWLDVEGKKLEEFLTLPSGGDTSYPGLVLHDGLLWVSYYSSHEGKTSIYLAKVELPPKP